MVAPFSLLDPESALLALLHLLPSHELLERGVVFVRILPDLIILACLILVEEHATVETIVFIADQTPQLSAITLIVDKGILAVSCGAPRDVILRGEALL